MASNDTRDAINSLRTFINWSKPAARVLELLENHASLESSIEDLENKESRLKSRFQEMENTLKFKKQEVENDLKLLTQHRNKVEQDLNSTISGLMTDFEEKKARIELAKTTLSNDFNSFQENIKTQKANLLIQLSDARDELSKINDKISTMKEILHGAFTKVDG